MALTSDYILSLREDPEEFKQVINGILKENEELKAKVKELEAEVKNLKTGRQEEEVLFQIDTNPDELPEANPEEEQIQSDEILFTPLESILTSDPDTENNTEDPKRTGCCFNCNGTDHNVSECPKPRNQKMIDKNRKEFRRRNDANLTQRYHIDEEQKFNHLKPGLPSKKLREALGLRDNQLPSYIYRMRQMGYPPGWKKEAEIHRSGVNLHLSQDRVLGFSNEEEDGEVREKTEGMEIDITKVVEWPGFNVEFPKNYLEESRRYRCPKMKDEQLKSNMIKQWGKKVQSGYIRGQMQDTSVTKNPSQDEILTPASPDSEFDGQDEPCVSLGTPIVSTFSPYDRLPNQDQWAKDTTDHILFDNLPDSTGKWDQMREVIKRGRDQREQWEKHKDNHND